MGKMARKIIGAELIFGIESLGADVIAFVLAFAIGWATRHRAVTQPQFGEDARDVGLHGGLGEEQR